MIEVTVEFYSGFQADETPRALLIDGRRLLVRSVIRREIVGSVMSQGGYHRTFVVELEDGSIWHLREAPEIPAGWIAEGNL